ncbi:MAG: ATP-binding protein, partial [Opitutales bacterium]
REAFNDTDFKVKVAQKKLNQLSQSDELELDLLKNIRISLDGMTKQYEMGREIIGQGKNPADDPKFKRDYGEEISNFSDLINELELAKDNLEKKRKATLLELEKEHRPEDRRGLSTLMITLAVIACGVGPLLLAWGTYRIVARPIQLLATAAAKSLDQGKPFEMKETGPAEVRSLAKRLGSLVQGLEERVLMRTSQLQAKAAELEQEMEQRKELEGQLVFAQKMEAVGQLAAGIAHEVNTPSQYVCDNLRFLEQAVTELLAAVAPAGAEGETAEKPDAEELAFLSENAPEAVEQALQGMERITSIVKSMKNFAYRDATSEKKPQDLNQAIQATIVVATNEWKYYADLQTDLDPGLPFVPCNIGEINQVVLNLIVNAAHAIRDANPDGQKGHITVSTRQYDDFVVITIQDNGRGIPEDVQAKVFEPFFTTKEVGVGTGQGLAIAHNVITKSHGGHLWFETEPGAGTSFFIRLPLKVVQEMAEA